MMAIVVEGREAVQKVPDILIIRVEDMWAVVVDLDAFHFACVAVAGYVVAFVDDVDFLPMFGGYAGKDGSKHAGAYYEILSFCRVHAIYESGGTRLVNGRDYVCQSVC